MVTVVAIGSIVSNVTCLVIWPTSSTTALQRELKQTAVLFGDLLGLLGRSVLNDDDSASMDTTRLQQAAAAHSNSFTRLKANLEMAKLEFYDKRIAQPAVYAQSVRRPAVRLILQRRRLARSHSSAPRQPPQQLRSAATRSAAPGRVRRRRQADDVAAT